MASVLGIDIDQGALRATLVRSVLRKLDLERAVAIPLTSAPGTPERAIELQEAVAGLQRTLGELPDAVVTSIGGELASLRTLEVPEAAGKRLAELLPFELEAVLPFEPEDAIIDHQVVGSQDGKLRVLAAGVLRKRIAETLGELQAAGLDPRELGVGATALDGLVTLVPSLATESVIVIELQNRRTDVCFLEKGRCAGARTLTIGIDALGTGVEELARGLKRTIVAHRAAGGVPPTRALICGVGAHAEGAPGWFAEQLGLPTDRLALPAPAAGGEAPPPMFGRAAALAGRAALGNRSLNLRKEEFAPPRARLGLAQHGQLVASCIVALMLAITFSLKAQQSVLASERTALRARIATTTKEVLGKSLTNFSSIEAAIKDPTTTSPLPRFDAYDALATMSSAISEDVGHQVRRVRIDVADEKREGTFELQGILGRIEERDAIVTALQAHECFDDIKTGRTTPAGGGDRINYQLEAMVRCEGDSPSEDSKSKKGKKK